jgi:hypothetical protein
LALLVSLTATGAIAIGILLFAEFDETAGKILWTTTLVALFSLFALPSGVLLDQNRYRWLAWTAIVVATAAFAVTLVLVWTYWGEDAPEGLWKSIAVLGSFAAAGALVSGTTARRSAADSRAVRWLWAAGIVLSLLAATLVSIAVAWEVERSGFFRILGAVVVAAVLAVVVQLVAGRMAGGAPAQAFAFRCTLDGAAPAGLPAGYAAAAGESVVACEVSGADFAAAVAAAIRTLEREGARVERVERVG